MIGIDTNVLVRYLMRDDPIQFEIARQFIEQAEVTNESVFLSIPVLIETVWVLRRAYKLDRAAVVRVLNLLLESQGLSMENVSLIESATYFYSMSNADFSDCLIGILQQQFGCQYTVTFDRRAARLPFFDLLTP